MQIEKKSMASIHLFLRPDINISPLRAFFRRKKLIEGGGGGKGRCCGRTGRTAITRMKAPEILVYTYKI